MPRLTLGVTARTTVISCAVLAFRSAWWAAVDPARCGVLPVVLWMAAAGVGAILLPVLARRGGRG
ncbi:hypothetical protein [Deinococcus aquiradiocola]|uniref:Uncharacterized protein n=1 Tax=Deinococcus aquiradiocola TaxID=393059 RepID=A0A917PSF2_9DEIO|nr:hypothetical protein [Deinococcus aquiradiocola]GGJ89953.1 hypothetical protein GCM10008939_37390 [Deinococcus aquiradiocola]